MVLSFLNVFCRNGWLDKTQALIGFINVGWVIGWWDESQALLNLLYVGLMIGWLDESLAILSFLYVRGWCKKTYTRTFDCVDLKNSNFEFLINFLKNKDFKLSKKVQFVSVRCLSHFLFLFWWKTFFPKILDFVRKNFVKLLSNLILASFCANQEKSSYSPSF